MAPSKLLAVLFGLVLAGVQHAVGSELKVQSVDRKINLNSQFGRITETYKIKNTGSSPANRFTLCHARQSAGLIAHHKVSQVADKAKVKAQFTPVSPAGAPAEAVCWEVQLSNAVPAGEVAQVESSAVYANVQTPYPAMVSQGEQQLMLYHDNVHVLSPYTVSTQTTEVVLPSSNVKSYTDSEKPVTKSDNRIKYGKYDLVKPWSVVPMRVHFETSKPFKKVASLVREIEVSHWGNIYVEEIYDLRNEGAKHKGAFSRLKHSGKPESNSFQDLKAKLPAAAHSLYYVDTIGNISDSTVRKTALETSLEFQTRYPLLGGWKTDFAIGYSLPLTGFLHRIKGGKRRLTMDFSTSLEGSYVEELVVKVVLPEGSTGIKVSGLPYDVDERRDVKFTYLDVSGRPVVVLRKSHVVPEHATKFNVDYSFPAFGVWREPLMLISAFAVLFLVAILYNRLEFTINRDEKWQAQQEADQVATVMQAINDVMEEEDEVLESVTKVVNGIRSTADADHAAQERNTLESSFTALENKVNLLVSSVAAVQPRVAEKVRDLQERLRGLEQRLVKQLTERCDLVRKGSSGSEAAKKQATAMQAINAARVELAKAVSNLFSPY